MGSANVVCNGIIAKDSGDIRREFLNAYEYHKADCVSCKVDTLEIIGASFLANEPSIFGTVNQEYVDAEISWYLSQSTNVNQLHLEHIPAAWQATANMYGEINSNYGYLIFSNKYGQQFYKALSELTRNNSTRRATMVYTRPDIWKDYNDQGKNDFICTNAVTYYIRNGLLHTVVQMRSNDVVFGYKNDYAWQVYVRDALLDSLPGVEAGDIYWQVQNLHVYRRHFHLLET